MTRFRQERGLLRHQKIVKVPRPVVLCQGEVRQAMAANVQKEEKKVVAEPTTLAGAVRALNALNDGKMTMAQQRLRDKETKVLDRRDSVSPGDGSSSYRASSASRRASSSNL